MNIKLFTCSIVALVCFASQKHPGTAKDLPVFFAGTTPCSNIIRPLHNIAKENDCELKECACVLVEWKLALYFDPGTKQPSGYQLSSINRFTVKETNMYSQPGTMYESKGKWEIVRGSKTNPGAIVYRLNPDKPGLSVDFLKLSDSLLHILDQEGRLMIGDEFFSYTLNRVKDF